MVGQKIEAIRNRASASQKCETCPKKERYNVVHIKEGTPGPPILFMMGSPLTVLIKETHVGGHAYLIYRCQDPMCLLALSRQVINEYWIDAQRRHAAAMQEQASNAEKNKKKRSRRRKFAKKVVGKR